MKNIDTILSNIDKKLLKKINKDYENTPFFKDDDFTEYLKQETRYLAYLEIDKNDNPADINKSIKYYFEAGKQVFKLFSEEDSFLFNKFFDQEANRTLRTNCFYLLTVKYGLYAALIYTAYSFLT